MLLVGRSGGVERQSVNLSRVPGIAHLATFWNIHTDPASEKPVQTVRLIVNGNAVGATADPETPLLDILRNHLGLMGTKFGCGLEQCGCCMVLVDGKPEKSCGKPLSTVAGREIVTIEGLGTPDRPHPLQRAFIDEQAGQCGYCLPGILITAKALLDRNPSPSRSEIAEALDDNICRCGSHVRILRAVERAAGLLREGGAR